MLERLASLLRSPSAPALLGALAVLLALPSLGNGLQTDDHLLLQRLDEGAGAWELFAMTPERVALLRPRGVFVWWSDPDLRVWFLRPVAGFTHAVDLALWREHAWAMHLVNVVLYGLLVAVAALLYRRILGPGTAAGLAALMFAVDEGHALSVGWIASRNTLLGALFSLLALLAYVRGREPGAWPARIASPLCTALALLSGEIGVSSLVLLGAYAWLVDTRSPRERLTWLLPHAAVGLCWIAIYVAGGYGAHGTSWYRDVRADPAGSLLQALADLPLWLLALLGPSVANATAPFPPGPIRAVALPLAIGLLALLVPALRARPQARFFAAAALLSIAPLLATMPQDRVLVVASFGGFGWLACAIVPAAGPQGVLARHGRRGLVFVHLVLAPLLFLPMLRSLAGIEAAAQALSAVYPDARGHHVVAVNGPLELMNTYATVIRMRSDRPAFASLHTLHAGASELLVERIDDRTLDVEARAGWGRIPFERIFASERSLRAVREARAHGMRATVLSRHDDGRPRRVRFAFDPPLESPHRSFVIWERGRPRPWRPPPAGARVQLPALDVLGALQR